MKRERCPTCGRVMVHRNASEISRRIKRLIDSDARREWTAREVIAHIGSRNKKAVLNAVNHLIKTEKIIRIRRGVYAAPGANLCL